jgi:hypothetical protein
VVDGLFEGARCIVYPSHYEGFGIPILRALAHGKPVIARRIPAAEEIAAAIRPTDGLRLCDSTEEIVSLALDQALPDPGAAALPDDQGLERCAKDYLDLLERAAAGFDFERLVGHLERIDQVERMGRRGGHARPGSSEAAVEAVSSAVVAQVERILPRLLSSPFVYGSLRRAWHLARRLKKIGRPRP